jgi:hypothetical protein
MHDAVKFLKSSIIAHVVPLLLASVNQYCFEFSEKVGVLRLYIIPVIIRQYYLYTVGPHTAVWISVLVRAAL